MAEFRSFLKISAEIWPNFDWNLIKIWPKFLKFDQFRRKIDFALGRDGRNSAEIHFLRPNFKTLVLARPFNTKYNFHTSYSDGTCSYIFYKDRMVETTVAFWWPSYLKAKICAIHYSIAMCTDLFFCGYTLAIKLQYNGPMGCGAAIVHGPRVHSAMHACHVPAGLFSNLDM